MALEIKVTQKLGLLNWNFEQINADLEIELKKYKGVVFSDDEIGKAKETRAKLNKVESAINEKKKEIKKEFCQPYVEFENQTKDIMKKISQVSSEIDKQIKDFENQKKQEKLEEITEWYRVNGLNQIDFERLYDPKWLNSSVKTKEWQEQLSSKIEKIKVDMAMIDSIEVEDKTFLKTLFINCLDISLAKKEYDRIEANKVKVKEIEQEQEQEVIQGVVNEIVEESEISVAPPEQQQQEVIEEELLVRCFAVKGTKEQLIALGNFMNENGIKFKKIETKG